MEGKDRGDKGGRGGQGGGEEKMRAEHQPCTPFPTQRHSTKATKQMGKAARHTCERRAWALVLIFKNDTSVPAVVDQLIEPA